jgi:hypothetical protein
VIASNPHHRLFPQRPAQGHAKPVKAIGPRGKVFGVFPHADQAAAALGIWRNAIVSALRKGNRAAGYYWRYVGVPDELQPLNNRLRSDHGTPPPQPPPELTWEGWITVAGKKRGRPPRRDSGKVKKGVVS